MEPPKLHTFYGLFYQVLEARGVFPGKGPCIFEAPHGFFFHCNRTDFFVPYERNKNYVIPPEGFAIQVIFKGKSMLAGVLGPTSQQLFGPDMGTCLFSLYIEMVQKLHVNESRENAVKLIDDKVEKHERLLLYDETKLREELGLKPKPIIDRF